jgi:hypothetical protein
MERSIYFGNNLLIICVVFYLIWWIVAFRPNAVPDNLRNGILLGIAVVSGFVGIIMMIKGLRSIPGGGELFSSRLVIWGGIGLYIVLLLITSMLLKRQVTTELLLIVAWAMLEIIVVNTMFGCGDIGTGIAVAVIIIIAVAAVISLACYLLYYTLEGRAAYVDGMIPLVITGLVMILISYITSSF